MVMEPDALAEFAAAAHVHKDLMDRFLEPMDVDSFSGRGEVTRYTFMALSQVAPKTMNLSSEHCNMSDWLRLEATVKVSVYMVAFSFATLITVIIITIISQNSKLRKEVRYILLCHHLLCISSYCGLGVVFQGMRAFLANSPILPQYNEGTWQPLQGNFTFRDDANIQRKLHNECKHFNSLATDPQQNILKTRLSDVLLTAAQE
ncbi:hypothetical protein MJT46_003929 [Ovis ammon polii x Ovis aries]|nr:hypothetical protein MJT46_003929 [Ovis ammon polii x Ovis aries]